MVQFNPSLNYSSIEDNLRLGRVGEKDEGGKKGGRFPHHALVYASAKPIGKEISTARTLRENKKARDRDICGKKIDLGGQRRQTIQVWTRRRGCVEVDRKLLRRRTPTKEIHERGRVKDETLYRTRKGREEYTHWGRKKRVQHWVGEILLGSMGVEKNPK